MLNEIAEQQKLEQRASKRLEDCRQPFKGPAELERVCGAFERNYARTPPKSPQVEALERQVAELQAGVESLKQENKILSRVNQSLAAELNELRRGLKNFGPAYLLLPQDPIERWKR